MLLINSYYYSKFKLYKDIKEWRLSTTWAERLMEARAMYDFHVRAEYTLHRCYVCKW